MNNFVNRHDSVILGITYDDIIIALQSNEKIIDKATVYKVYSEILSAQQEDAMSLLNSNMDFILKEAK